MSLCKKWRLNLAPINCRYSIFKRVRLIFDEEGRVTIFDTANITGGTYSISGDSITINYRMWTCSGAMWGKEEMYDEAAAADKFIQSLIENPFKYELKDDILIIFYDNQEYQFEEIN